MLTNVIFSIVLMTSSRKVSSTIGIRATNNLLGVTTMVYHTPLFSTKTFIIPNVQSRVVFCLMATSCEDGENATNGDYVK
jgi:hypothetical protein